MTKREGFEKRDIFSSGKLGERERFTKVSNGHQQESIALSFFQQPERHVFSRMNLDIKYIDNWSLGLDCKILLKTVWVVLKGEGR